MKREMNQQLAQASVTVLDLRFETHLRFDLHSEYKILFKIEAFREEGDEDAGSFPPTMQAAALVLLSVRSRGKGRK